MKTCGKCGGSKPFDQFSKNKHAKDGRQYQCKDCVRAHYQANREQILQRNSAYRNANREKIYKQRRAYWEATRDRRRTYYEANRERILERNRGYYNPDTRRAYYEANRERSAETGRAHYEANRERYAERQRAYRRANRERLVERERAYYEANRQRYAENGRAWRNANADKRRGYFARRRARKACAVPQRWQVHDVLPFCCYWCGANLRAYGATTHVDHVMPILLGGPADPSNEVTTCASCNFRKNAKHPLVWIAELVA